jgi:hypothetical protein
MKSDMNWEVICLAHLLLLAISTMNWQIICLAHLLRLVWTRVECRKQFTIKCRFEQQHSKASTNESLVDVDTVP